MEWKFNVSDGSASYALKAEVIYVSYQIEHIKVTGEGISVVLQNNRPLLEAIELKRPLTWKVFKGKIKDEDAFERITTALENSLKLQRTIA